MGVPTTAELRRINLIQTLFDEAQSAGESVAEPPETAALHWSEDQVRQYFSAAGRPHDHAEPVDIKVTAAEHVRPAYYPSAIPSLHDFERWFPGTKLHQSDARPAKYKYRVLCFHNAGNAEDMFTSEGTGPRKAISPLLDWCRREDAECLAVQLPGRATRSKEPFLRTAQQFAQELLPVIASQLQDTPYIIVGHSLGAWLAYEFLCHARRRALPMPVQAFLSAMPDPSIPAGQRPWQQQNKLQEKEFQAECRCWDINEVVFSPALWPMYQNILRADFSLFDQYKFEHADEDPFGFPVHTFYGTKDARVSAHMVHGWRRFTRGAFSCEPIDGNHLWPLDKAAKSLWLQSMVNKMQATL